MKQICRSVVALMLGSMPAMAQDNWAGSYVGASLVLGDAAITAQGGLADQLDRHGIDDTLFAPKGEGIALRVGRDWQNAQLVMGISAEYMAGHIAADASDARIGAVLMDPNVTMSDRLRVSGRIGYVAGDWLPYVIAGQDVVRMKVDGGIQGRGHLQGNSLGLGVEHRISHDVTTFAEYSRTRFDPIQGAEDQLDIRGKNIQLGANFRF
jgi:opacity protein-like surface antigen